MAVDRAAAGAIAKERKPGGIPARTGRTRFRAVDEAELLGARPSAENFPADIGPNEAAEIVRRRDDASGRPSIAAEGDDLADVREAAVRLGLIAVDVRNRQVDFAGEAGAAELERLQNLVPQHLHVALFGDGFDHQTDSHVVGV